MSSATSTTVSRERPLRIAIIGGGIAGLTLAIPLARAQESGSPIDVHVYEAAAAFTEIGAGIGLGPNAQKALEKMGILNALSKLLVPQAEEKRAKSLISLRNSKPGLSAEESVVSQFLGEGGAAIVHRADFLQNLVDMLPDGHATFHKRLDSYVDRPGEPIRMKFSDGTEAEADVLIGCDGVKSRTRRCMFAEDSSSLAIPEGKATRAKYSGWIAYRAVITMEEARPILGDLTMPTLWMGYDRHLIHMTMRNETLVNLVMVVLDREGKRAIGKDGPWSEEVDQSLMIDDFKDFNDQVKALVKLVKKPSAWGVFDIPELPWFNNGRVAIAGDAAHASTMHQGAGAGQGVEDSYILYSLLTHPDVLSAPIESIPVALKAYSHVRRSRANKVQRTSAETGMLYEYCLPGVMDDHQKIKETVDGRFEWIWYWDDEQALKEALDYFAAGTARSKA